MYLGVDGGQTGTRGVLVARDGEVLARAEAGGLLDAVAPGGVERMREVLTSIRDQCASRGMPEGVFMGLTATVTGTPSQGLGEGVAAEIWPESERRVEGDGLVAWAGGTGGTPGVAAMAGTGSVVVAVNEAGDTIETGGWGHLFGDWGSGWHIGATAVRRMVQRWDRDRGSSTLGQAVVGALGVASPSEIPPLAYAGTLDVVAIARLAEVVARVAAEGDPEASSILEECAASFADDVANAIAHLSWTRPPVRVVAVGHAFRAGSRYRASFERTLQARTTVPMIFGEAVLSGLGGAALLALGLGGVRPSADLAARLAAQGLGPG